MDSPDCLLLFLSMSVFYLQFFCLVFVGSVRQIKLTDVGFRAHVKIASRIVKLLENTTKSQNANNATLPARTKMINAICLSVPPSDNVSLQQQVSLSVCSFTVSTKATRPNYQSNFLCMANGSIVCLFLSVGLCRSHRHHQSVSLSRMYLKNPCTRPNTITFSVHVFNVGSNSIARPFIQLSPCLLVCSPAYLKIHTSKLQVEFFVHDQQLYSLSVCVCLYSVQ